MQINEIAILVAATYYYLLSGLSCLCFLGQLKKEVRDRWGVKTLTFLMGWFLLPLLLLLTVPVSVGKYLAK